MYDIKNYLGVFDEADITLMLECYLQKKICSKLKLEEYTGYPELEDMMNLSDATVEDFDMINKFVAKQGEVKYLRIKGSQYDGMTSPLKDSCRIHFFYVRNEEAKSSLLDLLEPKLTAVVDRKDGIKECKHYWFFDAAINED
jgi:hypothetical protein